jgi:phenylalanyl-tRNA synthetase beta chain
VLSLRDWDGKIIGTAGRVADGAVDTPSWAGDIWALEVTLPSDIVGMGPVACTPLSNYPSIEWDLALVLPPDISADSVSQLISREAGKLLEHVNIFDVAFGSEGGWVPREMAAGISLPERSLGFRLRFRALERTLKDKEIDEVIESLLRRLEEELGVEARR